MMLKQGGGGHNLPSMYQEVEWIKTERSETGTYIYPNILLDSNDWGLKIINKQDGRSTYFGYISVGGWYQNSLYVGAGGTTGYLVGGFINAISDLRDYTGTKNVMEINFKNSGKQIINGVTVADGVTSAKQSARVYILAFYYGSAIRGGSYGILEELAISRGDNVILDLIPCYRKSDNVIGMYDLAGTICPLTDTPFYVSAGPNSNFLIGPDVN